jgi:glutamine synthetase
MLRVPGPGRIENRTVDGACNPYLATTVLLAAGLDGIERLLASGAPNFKNMFEAGATAGNGHIGVLPSTLAEAVDALEQDSVLCEALGADYATTYIAAKREEWEEYHNAVSQWEVDRYIDLY